MSERKPNRLQRLAIAAKNRPCADNRAGESCDSEPLIQQLDGGTSPVRVLRSAARQRTVDRVSLIADRRESVANP